MHSRRVLAVVTVPVLAAVLTVGIASTASAVEVGVSDGSVKLFENGLLEVKLPKSAPTGKKITIQ